MSTESEYIDIDEWRTAQLARQILAAPLLQPVVKQASTPVQEPLVQPPSPKPPAPSDPNPILEPSSISDRLDISIQAPSDPVFDPAIPGLDDLVKIWYFIRPDVKLYPWQAEELYRLSGYVTGNPKGPRIHYHHDKPCYYNTPAANGSGKDMVLIGAFAVGTPLLYREFATVITSASHVQLQYQTEPHIVSLISSLHERLGGEVFRSITFFHEIKARQCFIKLFSTDEAGRAEGWHPHTKSGKLAVIVNEAKTVSPEITKALDRCHGVSHQLYISSPGPRSGIFYNECKTADKYPTPLVPGRPWTRRVDYTLCPHITADRFQRMVDKHGFNSYLVQTSFFANFYEEEVDVIIPSAYLDLGDYVMPDDAQTIGIGIDCAAGGDETVVYVRKGNTPINFLAFQERNTLKAIRKIDDFLSPYKSSQYTLNLDDGGVGRNFGDNLNGLGWRINRHHNQSAAIDKSKFLNKGAEMYWHVRDLLQAQKIRSPQDELTRAQLCTRKKVTQEGQGKIRLESKDAIRDGGGQSPDRADAFVLAFYSFWPSLKQAPIVPASQLEPGERQFSIRELAAFLRRNPTLTGEPRPTTQPHPYYQHEQLWNNIR